MLKSPEKYIWLARDKVTKEYVFIPTGAMYDQQRYTLLYSVSGEEVNKLILKETC